MGFVADFSTAISRYLNEKTQQGLTGGSDSQENSEETTKTEGKDSVENISTWSESYEFSSGDDDSGLDSYSYDDPDKGGIEFKENLPDDSDEEERDEKKHRKGRAALPNWIHLLKKYAVEE